LALAALLVGVGLGVLAVGDGLVLYAISVLVCGSGV